MPHFCGTVEMELRGLEPKWQKLHKPRKINISCYFVSYLCYIFNTVFLSIYKRVSHGV